MKNKTQISADEGFPSMNVNEELRKTQPTHTQGVWRISKLNDISIVNSDDIVDGLICQVNGKNGEERKANIQRIVKAVNLLSSMERELKNLNYNTRENPLTEYGFKRREILTDILKTNNKK
jgi:hypothetical protein